jgi:hypothetical protein
VLVAEDGTSYAAFGLQLPPDCTFVSQVIWGSIGYSVGSLLGTLTAAPDRRHLLFAGDGSFQLTAQEVSTMLRHDYKPVIFLINNGGYTIERCWLGKTSRFNDVANWAYADLPKVFRPDTTARSFVVKTVADLEKALSAPNDSLIFIESIMDPFDAPAAVINSGNDGADLDYGPRGPQHRDNMLIRPATLFSGGCPELGDYIGWDSSAVFDFHAVRLGPVAYLVGAEPVRSGLTLVAGWLAGGARDLPAGLGVGRERAPQFLGVDRAQVNLVVCAVQAETDGAVSFAAIEVIDEQRLYPLCHPYLRSGWFTLFDSTSYAISAIE